VAGLEPRPVTKLGAEEGFAPLEKCAGPSLKIWSPSETSPPS